MPTAAPAHDNSRILTFPTNSTSFTLIKKKHNYIVAFVTYRWVLELGSRGIPPASWMGVPGTLWVY